MERYENQRASLAKYFVDDDEVIQTSNRISATLDANRASQINRRSGRASNPFDVNSINNQAVATGTIGGGSSSSSSFHIHLVLICV